jgi:hypothetical protein
MLAPQFSFRTLLAGMAVAALASLVVAAAVRGNLWAFSIGVGIAGILVCFMLFFLAFTLAFAIASVWQRIRGLPRATPFSGKRRRKSCRRTTQIERVYPGRESQHEAATTEP